MTSKDKPKTVIEGIEKIVADIKAHPPHEVSEAPKVVVSKPAKAQEPQTESKTPTLLQGEALEQFKADHAAEITAKRNELGPNVINDNSAAQILARQMGTTAITQLEIGDLEVGMEKIRLTAQVMTIGKTSNFTRNDGTNGKVCKVTVGDDTGTAIISLWDKQVDILDTLKKNDTVFIDAWKVDEGYQGRGIEIKLGKFGEFEIVASATQELQDIL